MCRLARPAAALALVPALVLTVPTAGAQTFLDVTLGSSISFFATLGTTSVTGLISNSSLAFNFATLANQTSAGGSTTNGTSPQFSYAGIFSPTAAAADRVGFTASSSGTSIVSFSFSTPVTNPTFHFANLDGAAFVFAVPAGSVTLLSGNGGGGDGFTVVGNTVQDANPGTALEQAPGATPGTTGARSAYGSVRLTGTFTALAMITGGSSTPDNGSFTISLDAPIATVPEPATLALVGGGLVALGGVARRRSLAVR